MKRTRLNDKLLITDKLLKAKNAVYGSSYQSHLLEQYKLFVEMTDRISQRRQTAHHFFITLNTLLMSFSGYVQMDSYSLAPFYIGIAGILLSCLWYQLIKAYKQLNGSKFQVILEIEQLLPLSPYEAEWKILKKENDIRGSFSFSKIELGIPILFFLLYFINEVWLLLFILNTQ